MYVLPTYYYYIVHSFIHSLQKLINNRNKFKKFHSAQVKMNTSMKYHKSAPLMTSFAFYQKCIVALKRAFGHVAERKVVYEH